jgi:prevent-host-death family protein
MKTTDKTARKAVSKPTIKAVATGRPYTTGEIPASEARDSFAHTLNRVSYGKERVVIRRHGKGIAAVVPMEDYELLERLEEKADIRAARRALAELDPARLIPLEEVKRRLGIK